ncbi:MAG: hypothetical protein LBI86_08180, partial [Treponema sp.]|nr:hypothetical protein [Treponema sp.]
MSRNCLSQNELAIFSRSISQNQPGFGKCSLVCCCLLAAALLAGCRKAGGFVLFFEIPDLWDGTVAAGFAGGSGSAADPYRI